MALDVPKTGMPSVMPFFKVETRNSSMHVFRNTYWIFASFCALEAVKYTLKLIEGNH